MIVIFGMAHSGTTITAYILSQYGKLYTSGKQKHLLECAEVASHKKHWQAQRLKDLQANTEKHLLIKRPWTENRPEFWMSNFPDAYYICLIRPFAQCYTSWTGPRSMVPKLKHASIKECWACYKKHLHYAVTFPASNYFILDYTRLTKWPKKTFEAVAEFLGTDFKFDTSKVNKGNIKQKR